MRTAATATRSTAEPMSSDQVRSSRRNSVGTGASRVTSPPPSRVVLPVRALGSPSRSHHRRPVTVSPASWGLAGVLVSQGGTCEGGPPGRAGRAHPRRLLVVALAVVLTGIVRQSWPQTSGEIKLNGLGGRVEVIRDDHGIPQIYADSTDDLFRAQGFVAAQDRFFEMDFRRHVTAGRLSELVGSAGLETDRVVRTMGWRNVAEKELALRLAGDASVPQRLRRRRQRLHRPGGEPERHGAGVRRARPAVPRVLGREVVRRRLAGLAQGDGLGPHQQLRGRADASPPGHHARPGPLAVLFPRLPDRRAPADPRARRVDRGIGAGGQCRQPSAHRGRRPARARGAVAGPAQRGHVGGVRERPGGARLDPGPARPRRRHRLQLVGRRRVEDDDRQAAAGQRPAPRDRHPGDLVPDRPALPDASPPPARSTSRATPSPVCRASSSATTSRSPGA